LHAGGSAIGPAPTPGLLPPPGSTPKKAPLGSPDYEFFVFVKEETLENLKLPDKFVEVFAGHESGYAFLREASAGQKTWRMTIYRDGTGCMFFTGNWKEFALCYKLEQGFLLTFRHRQGTYNFVVRVFDGLACRRFYHPVEE
jgi:hypothetical protein